MRSGQLITTALRDQGSAMAISDATVKYELILTQHDLHKCQTYLIKYLKKMYEYMLMMLFFF